MCKAGCKEHAARALSPLYRSSGTPETPSQVLKSVSKGNSKQLHLWLLVWSSGLDVLYFLRPQHVSAQGRAFALRFSGAPVGLAFSCSGNNCPAKLQKVKFAFTTCLYVELDQTTQLLSLVTVFFVVCCLFCVTLSQTGRNLILCRFYEIWVKALALSAISNELKPSPIASQENIWYHLHWQKVSRCPSVITMARSMWVVAS